MSVIRGTYSDVPGIPSESCPVFSGRGPDSVIYVTDPTKKNYNYTYITTLDKRDEIILCRDVGRLPTI